jgi:RNA methyltransferase, TrmH family
MPPKRIQQLTEKKYRKETGLFIVEGEKNILELLASDFTIEGILGTKPFLNIIDDAVAAYENRMNTRLFINDAPESTLTSNGTLMSNNAGIAVAQMRPEASDEELLQEAKTNIVIVLEDIQNPGNLGTIIRLADWYGVSHIAASPTTADFYNPKVIGASMGSFTRVTATYLELQSLLREARAQQIPVIAADLEGASTHTIKLPSSGFLLMGSESHGVSKEALSYTTDRVMIPRFGKAESLNVGVATGILLDTIRRQ